MPPPKPLKADKLIADIHKASGNLAAVARAYGISRQAVWEFVQRHPTCKAAWEDERQTMVDVAESALKARVLAGDTTAIIFTLKTQGKERGYVERIEQEQSGDLRIRVEYVDDLNDENAPPVAAASRATAGDP